MARGASLVSPGQLFRICTTINGQSHVTHATAEEKRQIEKSSKSGVKGRPIFFDLGLNFYWVGLRRHFLVGAPLAGIWFPKIGQKVERGRV